MQQDKRIRRLLAAFFASAVGLFSIPVASAGDGGFIEGFSPWYGIMLLLGVIGLLAMLAMWKGLAHKTRIIGAIAVGFLLAVPIVGMVGAPGGDGGGDGLPVSHHSPITVTVPSTRLGTPHDAISEVTDSDGFTAANSVESPAATLCAYGTNAYIDVSSLPIKVAVHNTMDDDVATSDAAFSAPDVCGIDLQIQIQGYDGNGDNNLDAQPMYARAMVSVVTAQDTNSSERQIWVWDVAAGSYITGVQVKDTQATGDVWYSFWESTASPGGVITASTWSNWHSISTSTGANPDFLAFFFQQHNFGPFGFVNPPIGSTLTISYQFSGPDKDPNSCGSSGTQVCQVDFTETLLVRT